MSDFSNIFEGVDADNASSTTFDNSPVPPAEYHLSVVNAELRTSKAGNPYIMVQYRVEDDQPCANRRIFVNYNMGHPTSRRISEKALSVLAKAAGIVGKPSDASQFIGGHVWGEVTIEAGSGDWPDRNGVKWVNPYEGQTRKEDSQESSEFDAF